MAIKKNFEEMHALLSSNQDRLVSDIMAEMLELMESKVRDCNHFEDEHGLWIFCYYHKEWELTKQVEYGSKINTKTGLNTMCKVGVNQWTRQQREYRDAKGDLPMKVVKGIIDPSELEEEMMILERNKSKILPLADHHYELAHKIVEKMIEEETTEE